MFQGSLGLAAGMEEIHQIGVPGRDPVLVPVLAPQLERLCGLGQSVIQAASTRRTSSGPKR
jgi:hypothetical protein